MATVRFPDGTQVTASSVASRQEDRPGRDFGLYMDPSWAPTWAAEMIEWPDFGVPSEPEQAAKQIIDAFGRARQGQRVEIGCIGGVGRTGTVLACMAVLSGVLPEDAVEWVRDQYHPCAVETDQQASWVAWFAAQLPGTDRSA
jgi:hypothetical protein